MSLVATLGQSSSMQWSQYWSSSSCELQSGRRGNGEVYSAWHCLCVWSPSPETDTHKSTGCDLKDPCPALLLLISPDPSLIPRIQYHNQSTEFKDEEASNSAFICFIIVFPLKVVALVLVGFSAPFLVSDHLFVAQSYVTPEQKYDQASLTVFL